MGLMQEIGYNEENLYAQPLGFNEINSKSVEKVPVQEDDYVQQMMKANVSKHGLGFGAAGGQGLSQAEQIKVLRSERKNKKKGKKAIKVQGY